MFNISNAIISEKLSEPLEKEKLYRLFKLLKDGNYTVKNQIIEHNLKLVLYVVNTRFSNLNYEKEDIDTILQDIIDKAKNRVVVASDVVVKYLKK